MPRQIFLGTLVQSTLSSSPPPCSAGKLSDRTGRRKIFVLTAAIVYGLAMFVIALASDFNGFLVGMAIGGLGFGMYMAVDLALVADVLPDAGQRRQGSRRPQHRRRAALLHRAGASRRPSWPSAAAATAVLYAVAGVCAILGAVAILPVRRVR